MKYLFYYILWLITGFMLFILFIKFAPPIVKYSFLDIMDIEITITNE